MKFVPKLIDGVMTGWQQSLIALWTLALASVVILWAPGGTALLRSGDAPSVLLAVGQLLGLLATFFALTQFLLMGRIAWIERAFGLDKLAIYHRFNGYAAIILILLHPFFIVLQLSVRNHSNYLSEYVRTIQTYDDVGLALIAEVLFVTVVVSSIYIARKHLKFESWYFVHMTVYAAIILAALHQFSNGGTFVGSKTATVYWILVYGFVAANVLFWRFSLPSINLLRFGWRVSRVVQETPTTTSVYIHGRGLRRFKVRPGQYVLVRIFARRLWWQEHPFSVSWIPHGDELRLTIRKVGDYTSDIAQLKPGAFVLLSGAFGRFTKEVAVTRKRLYIAGGVGITPLRAMAEEAVADGTDAVLLYANRSVHDVIFKKELDALADDGLEVHYIYSEIPKGSKALRGQLSGQHIQTVVGDFDERDIYICGPPPMIKALEADLLALQVQPEQIHYEQFSLHN